MRGLVRYFTLDALLIVHHEDLMEGARMKAIFGDGSCDLRFARRAIVNVKTGYNQI